MKILIVILQMLIFALFVAYKTLAAMSKGKICVSGVKLKIYAK
ncbi:hypothetical protein ACWIWK_00315 [Helicobacter sp. 23-1048]